MTLTVEVKALPGIPDVKQGDNLAGLLKQSLDKQGMSIQDKDVLVVSQKVVSKAEGRVVDLNSVSPSAKAKQIAGSLDRDPRIVQLVLNESSQLVRDHPVLIAETRTGHICANAGVDLSNVQADETAVLLPLDPDQSARDLRREISKQTGVAPAVLVSDSFGRPWRLGQTDVAIGCAGLSPLDDRRGHEDRYGRTLKATCPAVIDQIASAADLVRAKESGHPFVLIRGLGRHVSENDGPGARALLRPKSDDLFR